MIPSRSHNVDGEPLKARKTLKEYDLQTASDAQCAGAQEPQPRRVQLSRAKGWRMPPNTVKVDRTTIFGNPFTIEAWGRFEAVQAFRGYCTDPLGEDPQVRQDQMRLRARIASLRGKNLGCWCSLDHVCHADVLLELANGDHIAAQAARAAQVSMTPPGETK